MEGIDLFRSKHYWNTKNRKYALDVLKLGISWWNVHVPNLWFDFCEKSQNFPIIPDSPIFVKNPRFLTIFDLNFPIGTYK